MRQIFWLFFLIFCFQSGKAQIVSTIDESAAQDSLRAFAEREPANDSLKIHRPVITDYTFWRQNDLKPSVVDTTLTIDSFYRQNFTEKDMFGNMPFPNFGQTFNPLEYQENRFRLNLLPTGKSFNYLFAEDIRYFDVKTPMTEFVYESGLKEGNYLASTFTHNLNPQWNYSVRYRGLRSGGSYKNSLASNNAFIATISHHSKNDRFKLWTHYVSQNIDNYENAGIKNLNEFFFDDSLRTTNRQNIEVNLKTAYTQFDSRRFHLGAKYGLFGKSKTDSTQLSAPVYLKNVFTYEKQKFFYREKEAETYYTSPVFSDLERRNQKNLETTQNISSFEFKWGERLLVETGVKYENLKLYSGNPLDQGLVNIPKRIDDNLFGAIGNLYFDWNDKLTLTANAEFKSGDIFKNQYHINSELDIQPLSGYHLVAGLMAESSFPSLNLFYNQSFYKDFNFYNFSFDNTQIQKLYGKIELDKLNTRFSANLYNIDNYVYVDTDFRPKQLNSGISLFQFRGDVLIPYRKFNLNASVQYQKVTQNADFLPLPDLISRASIFYQNKAFRNKAEVQVGLNLNYFTSFTSREFFPVINEFMLQRENPDFGIQQIGGFPMLDFFFNIKVQRMQIFIRADHFNSMFGENNYFSAPSTPFRDFKLQMGVRWVLFT